MAKLRFGAIGVVAFAVLSAAPAQAQALLEFDTQGLQAIGWHGFLDGPFLLQSLAALLLAVALGAIIAYHPITQRNVDTVREAELPKTYILYALIGAMVGVTVLEYGMVVGFVVFGLGGLMRFRTETESTRDTGRLIIVTLLGLISGLNLPHFAIMSAAFAFLLIYLFDVSPVCRVVVKALPEGSVGQAAEAYRTALGKVGCRVLSERKQFNKRRVEFVFRTPLSMTHEKLHADLALLVPGDIRGEIDWEVE